MRAMTHFALWCCGLVRVDGRTTIAERNCLLRHATGKRRLVEIGVEHGGTTRCLRSVMAPDGVLFAIDPYQPGRLGFSANFTIAKREAGRVQRGTVRWLRTTGAAAGRLYGTSGEPPIDFAFIDGDHSYEGLRADWEAWSHLVEPGGIIALHDSHSEADHPLLFGSVAFTTEVVLKDAEFELVQTVDSLTVVRRSWPQHDPGVAER